MALARRFPRGRGLRVQHPRLRNCRTGRRPRGRSRVRPRWAQAPVCRRAGCGRPRGRRDLRLHLEPARPGQRETRRAHARHDTEGPGFRRGPVPRPRSGALRWRCDLGPTLVAFRRSARRRRRSAGRRGHRDRHLHSTSSSAGSAEIPGRHPTSSWGTCSRRTARSMSVSWPAAGHCWYAPPSWDLLNGLALVATFGAVAFLGVALVAERRLLLRAVDDPVHPNAPRLGRGHAGRLRGPVRGRDYRDRPYGNPLRSRTAWPATPFPLPSFSCSGPIPSQPPTAGPALRLRPARWSPSRRRRA